MDQTTSELRQRLAEVDERIDRIGKRFTAGYGSDADRDGWLAWLRELEAKRTAILAVLAARDAPLGRAPTRQAHEAPADGATPAAEARTPS